MSTASRSCAGCVGALLLVVGSANASPQTAKLNGPLARPIGGDIQSFQIDRPGNRVVYLADQEQDDVFELFSVRPGSRPIRLNPPLPADADVESFQLSPDGARVVYLARLAGPLELFTVSAKGGPSVRLDRPLAPGGSVASRFQIDASSRHVAFLAGGDLFVSPIDGSAPAVLVSDSNSIYRNFQLAGGRVFFQVLEAGGIAYFSAPLDGSGEPTQLTPFFPGRFLFEVTTDGSRALYVDLYQHGELFSVPGEGGTPVQLSSYDVNAFRVSPDGRRAVYEKAGLFSVPVLGGEAPIPLHSFSHDFQFDADGTHVIFVTPPQFAASIFTVPILGGADPVRIAGPGAISHVRSAPGGRVVFARDVSVPGSIQLDIQSAPVDGGEVPRLLTPVFWGTPFTDFSIVGDNVLYRSLTNPTTIELFTVPADGSRAPRRIDREMVAERAVLPGFATSGDGSRVAYLADRDFDEAFELFLAPADGSRPAMKLNPPLPIGPVAGDVSGARFSPDGTRAVFVADAREDEVFELFSVSSAGDEAPVRLNEPLVPGGDVTQFELASERVVYVADQEVNDVMHLYSVPLGGGTPVRLDGNAASAFFVELTNDGSKIVYRKDEDGDGFHELYVVPVDGGSPSALLDAGASSQFPLQRISPNSERLVYAGDPDRDGEVDLFSVPLAGGLPVRLSDPAPPGRIVLDCQITADGRRVLYLLRRGYYVQSLFSVPIDGSSSPIRLDAAPAADSSVRNFALAPDGSRVVFAADGVVEGLYELFSRPVDGSTGPLRLHTATADSPQITPDGRRVVYLVPTTPGAYALHAVPLDASSPPVVLSSARGYEAFFPNKPILITPDSTRVVFRAALSPREYQLHVVPLDGSHPPIRLSRPLDERGIVQPDFRLTPDGRTVVYRFGASNSLRGELLQVPIDGPRLPVRISRLPTFNGFDLSPDGNRVLHRATQDGLNVVELYASRLTDAPRFAAR